MASSSQSCRIPYSSSGVPYSSGAAIPARRGCPRRESRISLDALVLHRRDRNIGALGYAAVAPRVSSAFSARYAASSPMGGAEAYPSIAIYGSMGFAKGLIHPMGYRCAQEISYTDTLFAMPLNNAARRSGLSPEARASRRPIRPRESCQGKHRPDHAVARSERPASPKRFSHSAPRRRRHPRRR